jgi:hypothetical protein
MSQIFHRSANAIARASLVGAGVLAALGGFAVLGFSRSAYNTGQGVTLKQPVPFSHEHHVRGLGIDCRYCHTSVENAGFAGIPPTQTCMNCHRLIWKDSPMLAPVRDSFRSGQPIEWARVHDLPDFVYFNHSIHVAKGVGCATCHGRVDQMQLMRQQASLQMEWCLECHRNPAKFVRPKAEVFNMEWRTDDQAALGAQLVKEYKIRPPQSLTTCEKCHR